MPNSVSSKNEELENEIIYLISNENSTLLGSGIRGEFELA